MKYFLIYFLVVVSSIIQAQNVHVVPESKTVTVGSIFKAEVYVIGSKSKVSQISYKNKLFEVDNEGKGSFNIIASIQKNSTKDSLGRHLFIDTLKVILNAGKKKQEVIITPFEYYVVKPVLQIQTEGLKTLYVHSWNKLHLHIFPLGKDDSLTYSTDMGEKCEIKPTGKVEVVIIPSWTSQKTLTLYVSLNGIKIGEEKFNLKVYPKCDVTVLADGKCINSTKGIQLPGPQSLEVNIYLGECLATRYFADSKYTITKWVATLVRNKSEILNKTFSSKIGDITDFTSIAQPGDRIMVEVFTVDENKIDGEIIYIKTPSGFFNIPITD